MIIILCPYLVSLRAVFSKFRLLRWGWLSRDHLAKRVCPRDFSRVFCHLAPSRVPAVGVIGLLASILVGGLLYGRSLAAQTQNYQNARKKRTSLDCPARFR